MSSSDTEISFRVEDVLDHDPEINPSTDYLICYAKNESLSRSFNDEVKVDLFKKVENDGPRKGELYRDDVALYQSSLTHPFTQ